jgi:Tol biopolymer transport system component
LSYWRIPATWLTREQLRKQIWSEGTFVDFEHGLNAAMNKLRRALGDSAEDPRYIQTVPGRGYRFIASIQDAGNPELGSRTPQAGNLKVTMITATESVGSREKQQAEGQLSKRTHWIIGAAAIAVIAIAGGVWGKLHVSKASREMRVQQLTTNSAENPVWHAVISPDGKYVAYGDLAGIQIRLIATGESHLLPRPQSLSSGDAWFPAAWLADGTRILASSITSTSVSAWSVSVIGGAAAVLRDNALVQSASADGSLIAFIATHRMSAAENAINRRVMRNSEIWIMDPDGENARKVVSGDNLTYFGSVRWSPDGKRIAYQKFRLANGFTVDYTIEICDLKRGTPSIIVSKRHYVGQSIDHNFPEDFCWLTDGRVIYAIRESPPNIRDFNLWTVAVDARSGKLKTEPRKITNLAGFHLEGLSVTADGRRLLFESSSDQSYGLRGTVRGRRQAGKSPTLNTRSTLQHALWLDFR